MVFGAILIALNAGLAPASQYADRVREAVLPNGLKLILLEDAKAPVVVFQLWYRVGSRDESLGRTGLSHLLEHMMFRGTETVGPEEYSRIIQRNGGRTNAFTSQDATTYFATLASDRIEVVIELEADRMANLTMSDAQFVPERDVVMEERRLRTDNNPTGALFETLNAMAYAAHPYQTPIIGWMPDIAQSTVEDLVRHYRTYYVPNNAFVVAVGDFDHDDLVAEVERAFGKIAPGATPPTVRSLEPVQLGERRVRLERKAQLPFVTMAHHVPSLRSADGAALEVLAEVIAGGESARVHDALVYRQRVARSAGASYDYTSVDPGLFVLYAQPLPGQSATAVERALAAEIDRLVAEPPSNRELEKAKNGIEAHFVFAQDSLFYQGMLLGQYELVGDWRWIDEYLPAVRAVTADDLLRVTRFYLGRENRTVATLIPSSPAGHLPVASRPPSGPISR